MRFIKTPGVTTIVDHMFDLLESKDVEEARTEFERLKPELHPSFISYMEQSVFAT